MKGLISLFIVLLFLLLPPGLCGAEVNFTLLHTNDEHSSLIPRGPALGEVSGGAARLAGLVNEIRGEKEKRGEEVLLLSAGDFISGSPYAWLLLEGEAPELTVMQKTGYDLVTLGNHEFDYGAEALASYLRRAGYPEASQQLPIIASNIHPPADHPLSELGIRENMVVELKEGLKIGFLGLIGRHALEVTVDPWPVEFSDQHQRAEKMVQSLKDEGAQLIIALTHSGLEEDLELAAEVEGIDIIVGGHCHSTLKEPVMAGETIILQAGSRLEYLGMLELSYHREEGRLRIRNEEEGNPFVFPIDDSCPSDPEIEALVAGYTEKLNNQLAMMTEGHYNDILSPVLQSCILLENYPPYQETALGNFVSDALRLTLSERMGERIDFAIQASGQIRGSIYPDGDCGRLTVYDLVESSGLGMGLDGLPGYPLALIYLTGEEVIRALEISILLSELRGANYFFQVSGLRFTYDPERAVLFNIPLLDLPLPSVRSVLNVERYTGPGIQRDSDQYRALKRGDEELYSLVTDYYLLQFLPLVGEVEPRLDIIPRDREGNPLASLEDTVVRLDERELKVWQSLVEYAASLAPGPDGYPDLPLYYAHAQGRIVSKRGFPLLLIPGLILLIIIGALIFILGWRKKRKALKE